MILTIGDGQREHPGATRSCNQGDRWPGLQGARGTGSCETGGAEGRRMGAAAMEDPGGSQGRVSPRKLPIACDTPGPVTWQQAWKGAGPVQLERGGREWGWHPHPKQTMMMTRQSPGSVLRKPFPREELLHLRGAQGESEGHLNQEEVIRVLKHLPSDLFPVNHQGPRLVVPPNVGPSPMSFQISSWGKGQGARGRDDSYEVSTWGGVGLSAAHRPSPKSLLTAVLVTWKGTGLAGQSRLPSRQPGTRMGR